MKKLFFYLWFLFQITLSVAQNKVFYQQNFNTGKVPQGWTFPAVKEAWDPQWIVTDQPYPGSFKYQQQAPPIASKSRKHYLSYQAGYYTDEDVDKWVKDKKYPDSYIVSAPIDCSKRQSVILKFQHTFRWWNYFPSETAGLYVGISTDNEHWKEWDVRNDAKEGIDMLTPLTEEINISQWAANAPKVYIRFYWKGLQAWYWMIDDIELSESNQRDMSIVRLLSHSESGNTFTKQEKFRLAIRNNGSETIAEKIPVIAKVNGKEFNVQYIDATKKPIKSGESREITFPAIDLSKESLCKLSFYLQLNNDEVPSNNWLTQNISVEKATVGNLSQWKKLKNGVQLYSGTTQIKVLFYKDDIFRIWLSPNGEFANPAGNDIVINSKDYNPALKIAEDRQNIYLKSASGKLQIQKYPIQFSLFDAKGKTIWAERQPLTFGSKTTQYLQPHEEEYFYGGGMQNGYFSHKNTAILIEKGNGWNDGGRPNPAPFYMSTQGYGALRNTFDVGAYDFTKNCAFTHNENRFDCFYFIGSDLKDIIGDYTEITGRPFMPARWQLSMGDANCYNKTGITPDVIQKVADQYIKYDMPRGWILPNDGYGCGYTKLDSTVIELKKRGFYTGLWTENGVDKIATEVGTYGTRLCKLDVAWVGPGYKFALDGCKAAYEGIEKNSNARGFVWSVMGWAGSHRYSVLWTGDQKSDWEYIRFHIPTVIGAGLSAQNCATGDIDAIFGGSEKTYVRDLQWKCFTPVLMTMSGWAKKDKQPWIYGEPYTSINRKYLQLKMRLTPYMYTLMNEAYRTGVPAVRGLLLEYPDDPIALGKETQYQFLLGKSFLVAPVYKDEEKRDEIYLPEGEWIDYWDGTIYQGKQWLNNYNAPLEKLPLFVKLGSIIPMYPQMNYDGEKPLDTLTLDIYPKGNVSYQLYEDDGLTREYRKGVFATTTITANQAPNGLVIIINPIKGKYQGMLSSRSYDLQIHLSGQPSSVILNGENFSNWQYDKSNKKGILTVSIKKFSVNKKISLHIQK